MAVVIQKEYHLANGSIVTIRSYKPEDYTAFQTFFQRVAQETTNTLNYATMPLLNCEKQCDLWKEIEKHPTSINVGAFVEGHFVGNLGFFQRNPSHPWVAHIGAFGMAISKSHWGQGIGTRMISFMEEQASYHWYQEN